MRKNLSKTLPPPRSHCPISYALAFVGDKWTLIVLRDLIMGRKRYFQEFLESEEKIASNILAARLKLLEAAGLVTRTADPAHGRRIVYAPTAKAFDLLPAMLELVRWSAKYDPKTAAPAPLVKRIAEDREGFAAEIRSRHKPRR
jgi:DNA-binding HxlR family transcriptional regulator